PLAGRTFGAVMRGGNFEAESPRRLRSVRPAREQRLRIHLLTLQTPTSDGWISAALQQVERDEAVPFEKARAGHVAWWDQFWNRSWIRIAANPKVEKSKSRNVETASHFDFSTFRLFDVSLAYTLQRFVTACAGRSVFPIKFNGSIF